jgi:hypothetical protein
MCPNRVFVVKHPQGIPTCQAVMTSCCFHAAWGRGREDDIFIKSPFIVLVHDTNILYVFVIVVCTLQLLLLYLSSICALKHRWYCEAWQGVFKWGGQSIAIHTGRQTPVEPSCIIPGLRGFFHYL